MFRQKIDNKGQGSAEPDFIIAGEKLYTEEADVAGTATVTESAPAQETEVVQYTAPQVEAPVSAVPYSQEPASTPVIESGTLSDCKP